MKQRLNKYLRRRLLMVFTAFMFVMPREGDALRYTVLE